MVRQAGEGLCTHDVSGAAVDELEHLSGQEPSFSGLVSDGHNLGRHPRQIFDVSRRVKVLALGKCFGRR